MSSALVVRGRVHTNDPRRPRAEAVLLRDGRVVAVGRFEALLAQAPGADVLDAGEGAVLPGLVDGHAHPLGLGRALSSVRLERTRSMSDVVAASLEWAAQHPDGWVLGRGWDQTLWPTGDALPGAAALDAAFPQRPVYLGRVDGHAALVNRAALRATGVRDDAADPPGGRLVRRPDGTPTGLLIDAATNLVFAHLPAPTRLERERWLLAAARHCLALGLTGVHDAGVDPDTDEAYVSLAAARALPLRTYAMADLSHPRWRELVDQGVRPEAHLYGMRAAKLFADGALGSRGAQLCEAYCDDPGNVGLEVQSSDELHARAAPAARRGFQVCVHAIGDRANARVLDLFERLRGEGLRLDRPRIEHAQILRPADFARVRALGVVCAMQPVHATTDARFAERRLGVERLAGAYAWRSLSALGVPVALGSDFPVEPADPRAGFHAAIAREGPDRAPPGGWRPDEALTPAQALDGFTAQNAFASFREHEQGRLAPGCLADLTVLADDPFRHGDWLDARVLATIVAGELRS